MPIVNVTQIHIPPELPDEARRMVEDVNDLLRKVTEEISDLHANPKLYTLEQRRDIAERCEIALEGFKEMREQLRQLGLEWFEWPDTIE